jgi:hypothetical protein
MTDMTNNENEKNVFIQLRHFYNNGTAIHFKLFSGEWRNAIIRSINLENKKVYIKEFVLGTLEYRFDEIISDSICSYNLNYNRREE